MRERGMGSLERMPRKARVAPGGVIFHVLNRAAGTTPLFRTRSEYAAFEQIMLEAQQKRPTRILGWCLMKTHWHLVIWARRDGELASFVRWLSHTHAVRCRVARATRGAGRLYQGRFRSFPVERAEALSLLRLVERNAMSAGLVKHAEDWRWGSLWARRHPEAACHELLSSALMPAPQGWARRVNAAVSEKDMAKFRLSVQRNRPFGSERWQVNACRKWGMEHTMRPRGRPRGT
jgi:putative transposase